MQSTSSKIAVAIVIVLIVVIGIGFYMMRLTLTPVTPPIEEKQAETTRAQPVQLSEEQDLQSIPVDNLDKGLADIDAELAK